jgi:hypothetical protein
MPFDPFQLVTTPLDKVEAPQAPPPLDTGLLPALPPPAQIGPTGKGTPSLQDLFNMQPDQNNDPLYMYKTAQEERFPDSTMQFNPDPLGAADTEDLYAQFQGTGEKLLNATIKTGGTAAASFLSTFTGVPRQIDAIRQGKVEELFNESSSFSQTQAWLESLENKYPNYYSEWEREHPYLSALPFSGGAANFWGDKVIKNIGFTLGSLASSLLIDAGIEIATGGTATPATFVLAGRQLSQAISPLFRAFRNLNKVAAINRVDDLMGVAQVGGGITKGLQTMNNAWSFKKGSQFALSLYGGAQGEAMIEGYHTYIDTKTQLLEEALNKGFDLDPEVVQGIEETAAHAGKMTTLFNLPILMVSNALQFSNVIGGKHLIKQFESPFLKVIQKEGLTVVNDYSRKKAVGNVLRELVKDFGTEGGEEGFQYFTGNSLHDYYVDKFNGQARTGMFDYIKKNAPKVLGEKELWEEFFIGGLSGGMMGVYRPVKQNFFGAKAKNDQVAERLNNQVMNRFNASVQNLTHLGEQVEFTQDENQVNQFQSAHKALFSTVHQSLRFGTYDAYLDTLEDLKSLPLDEYNRTFQTEFENEAEKIRAVEGMIGESRQIAKEVKAVTKFYPRNPFDSPYALQRIQDIFKVNPIQAKNVQAQLFEDFKELAAYNISRLRNTRASIDDVEMQLKTRGIHEEVIRVLTAKTLSTSEYIRMKDEQLHALQEQVRMNGELYPGDESKVKPLQKKIDQIKKLKESLKTYRKKDKLTEAEEKKVQDLILREEFGGFIEDVDIAGARVNRNLEEVVAAEIETQVQTPEAAAQTQLEVAAELEEQEEEDITPQESLIPSSPSRLPFGGFDPDSVNAQDGDRIGITIDGEYIELQVGFLPTDRLATRSEIRAEDAEGNVYIIREDHVFAFGEYLPYTGLIKLAAGPQPEELPMEEPPEKKTRQVQRKLDDLINEHIEATTPTQVPMLFGVYLVRGKNKGFFYHGNGKFLQFNLKVEDGKLIIPEAEWTKSKGKFHNLDGQELFLLDGKGINENFQDQPKGEVEPEIYVPENIDDLIGPQRITLADIPTVKGQYQMDKMSAFVAGKLGLQVGDRVEFFAERVRTGTWNGEKVIEDGSNNPWGTYGILSGGGYIQKIPAIEQVNPSVQQKEDLLTQWGPLGRGFSNLRTSTRTEEPEAGESIEVTSFQATSTNSKGKSVEREYVGYNSGRALVEVLQRHFDLDEETIERLMLDEGDVQLHSIQVALNPRSQFKSIARVLTLGAKVPIVLYPKGSLSTQQKEDIRPDLERFLDPEQTGEISPLLQDILRWSKAVEVQC